MKIKDLLIDETKWTQNAYARDAYGKSLIESDLHAVSWCLSGALFVCYPHCGLDRSIIWYRITSKLSTLAGETSITAWNDAPERTFAEIRKFVLSLDEDHLNSY